MSKSISDFFASMAPALAWLAFFMGVLGYFQNKNTAKKTAKIAEENQAIARRTQEINLIDSRIKIRNAFIAIMDEFPRLAYGLGAEDIATARDEFRNADVYFNDEIHTFLTSLINDIYLYFRECSSDSIGGRIFMNENEIQMHETRIQDLRTSIIARREQGNTLFNNLMQLRNQ